MSLRSRLGFLNALAAKSAFQNLRLGARHKPASSPEGAILAEYGLFPASTISTALGFETRSKQVLGNNPMEDRENTTGVARLVLHRKPRQQARNARAEPGPAGSIPPLPVEAWSSGWGSKYRRNGDTR